MSCSWPYVCMFSIIVFTAFDQSQHHDWLQRTVFAKCCWWVWMTRWGEAGWRVANKIRNRKLFRTLGGALGSAVFGIYLPSGCACATVFFCESIVRCNKFRVRKLLGFSSLSLSFYLYLNEMYIIPFIRFLFSVDVWPCFCRHPQFK